MTTDPRQLVLTPDDLGPSFEQLRSEPAVLGSLSAGAAGWDSVLHSRRSGSLVESIVVIYPCAVDAATAATVAATSFGPAGRTQVIAAYGRVFMMLVVVPRGGEDPLAIAATASRIELGRLNDAWR